jgi:hypothetical protein
MPLNSNRKQHKPDGNKWEYIDEMQEAVLEIQGKMKTKEICMWLNWSLKIN